MPAERGDLHSVFAKIPLFSDSMGSASSYLEMVNHNVEIIARELEI